MHKKVFKDKEYYPFEIQADVKVFDVDSVEGDSKKELKASLDKLQSFLPDIDYSENVDLVPMACDAFVANLRNKNNQIIGTEKALEIADGFKFKFIDVEHDRERIVGVILTIGFTTYGENSQPITKEELVGTDQPFNVVVGGVLWPVVDQHISNVVEDSSNVLSKNYKKISASWELLSSDFEVVLFDESDKVLNQGTTVNKETYSKYLYTHGGNGKTQDGKIVCNHIVGDTLPLGIGLTTNPAADVKGVLAGEDKVPDSIQNNASDVISHSVLYVNSTGTGSQTSTGELYVSNEGTTLSQFQINDIDVVKKFKEIEEKIIKIESERVTASKKCVKQNNIDNFKIMTIKDITDENLSSLTANQIHDLIKSDLEKAAKKHADEIKEREEKTASTEKALEDSLAAQTELEEKYNNLQAEIDKIKTDEAARLSQEKFDARLEDLEASFDIQESAKSHIAKRLSDINSDEEYAEYKEELSAFLKSKTSDDVVEQDKEVVASVLDQSDQSSSGNPNNVKTTEDKDFSKILASIKVI